MSDLETRVRTGLRSEVDHEPADVLLPDVRRRVRRRRTRAMTAFAAATVLALAAVGGAVWQHQRSGQVAGDPRTQFITGATSVAATSSGTVFEVVSSDDCADLCTGIWADDGSGWERRTTFDASPASLGQAIAHLEMAPDGQNGWAWGTVGLYATHDGWRTSSRLRDLPYDPAILADVQASATEVWFTTRTAPSPGARAEAVLWHSPVGRDSWTHVDPPTLVAPTGERQTAGSWDLIDVSSDGRVTLSGLPTRHGLRIDSGDESGWSHVTTRCRQTGRLLPGAVPAQSVCGPAGRYLNWGDHGRFSSFEVALQPDALDTPDIPRVPDMLYVAGDRAVIDTSAGRQQSNLRLGLDDGVRDWSLSGRHVAIVTLGGRVFVSDDAGRHWRRDS